MATPTRSSSAPPVPSGRREAARLRVSHYHGTLSARCAAQHKNTCTCEGRCRLKLARLAAPPATPCVGRVGGHSVCPHAAAAAAIRLGGGASTRAAWAQAHVLRVRTARPLCTLHDTVEATACEQARARATLADAEVARLAAELDAAMKRAQAAHGVVAIILCGATAGAAPASTTAQSEPQPPSPAATLSSGDAAPTVAASTSITAPSESPSPPPLGTPPSGDAARAVASTASTTASWLAPPPPPSTPPPSGADAPESPPPPPPRTRPPPLHEEAVSARPQVVLPGAPPTPTPAPAPVWTRNLANELDAFFRLEREAV